MQSYSVPVTPAKFDEPTMLDWVSNNSPLCVFRSGPSPNAPMASEAARALYAYFENTLVTVKPTPAEDGTIQASDDGFSIAEVFSMCGQAVTMYPESVVRLLHHRVCSSDAIKSSTVRLSLQMQTRCQVVAI